MAIMSFVVNCEKEFTDDILKCLNNIPQLDLHGVHNGYQIVVVMEAPSVEMEALIESIRSIPHVETCEISFINVEDEIH